MLNSLKKFFSRNQDGQKKYAERTVLIVDDNPVDRRILEKTLKNLGCRVLLAEDGEKGLQTAVSEGPDIILSDCNMPHMDGVEMCRRLKGEARTKDIPVIFLTGEGSPRKVIECFELDAYNYMCKPIDPKVLTSQIEEILQKHLTPS